MEKRQEPRFRSLSQGFHNNSRTTGYGPVVLFFLLEDGAREPDEPRKGLFVKGALDIRVMLCRPVQVERK